MYLKIMHENESIKMLLFKVISPNINLKPHFVPSASFIIVTKFLLLIRLILYLKTLLELFTD